MVSAESNKKTAKKRIGIAAAGLFCLLALYVVLFRYTQFPVYLFGDTFVDRTFRALGDKLQIKNGRQWEDFTVKGVRFDPPSGLQVDYQFYMDWLTETGGLNANSIRVPSVMEPEFYHALADYNESGAAPLYLIQGIAVDESLYTEYTDAYEADLEKHLKAAAKDAVDAVHGNARRDGYTHSVSDFTLGFLIEGKWNPEFIIYTNRVGEGGERYKGRYIKVSEYSTAFETILARTLNTIFAYDTGKYHSQHLAAFGNHQDTDNLVHKREKVGEMTKNRVGLDENAIYCRDGVKTGIFAAYQVDLGVSAELNYEPYYIQYIGGGGEPSPYQRYLLDLKETHKTMPLVITGFGLSTSRGASGLDEVNGYNRGGLTEQEQAEGLKTLYETIVKTGCSGGCITELFDNPDRTAWNTEKYVEDEKTRYWFNAQDSEQSLGLTKAMSEKEIKYTPDGSLEDWADEKPFLQSGGNKFYIDYDEKYVYLAGKAEQFNERGDNLFLAFDVTPKSGSLRDDSLGLNFDREMDLLLNIFGDRGARMYVQEYYDAVRAREKALKEYDGKRWDIPQKDSPVFSPINQFVQKKIFFQNAPDLSVEELAQRLQETGSLYLSTDDVVKEVGIFSGQTGDYGWEGDSFEIRIPWMLLNFMDPSEMKIIGDLHEPGMEPMTIREIYIGAAVQREGKTQELASQKVEMKGWGEQCLYTIRKKEAFEAVKEIFR